MKKFDGSYLLKRSEKLNGSGADLLVSIHQRRERQLDLSNHDNIDEVFKLDYRQNFYISGLSIFINTNEKRHNVLW